MRRILAVILSVMLFVSCSPEESGRMALCSDGAAVVYLGHDRSTIMIRIGLSGLRQIEELSGLDGKDAVSALFSIPEENITAVSWDDYFQRRNLLMMLAKETHSSSPEAALWKNAKDLENTAFLDTINKLSSSFDESLLSAFHAGEGGYMEYRLESILPSASSWEDALDFIGRWVDAAMEIEI